MGVCNCSMFCCTLLCVRSSIAIILMGKRELVALLNVSSWCLVMVERLFLAVPQGCLRFVIVVFPDHTHLLFWNVDEMPHYAAFYLCLHSTHLKRVTKPLPVVLEFCCNCCNNKNPTHLKIVFVAISIRDI